MQLQVTSRTVVVVALGYTFVKPGYGEQYAKCFDGVGAEDVRNIASFGEDEMAALESSLRGAGAKLLHVTAIKAAVAALGAKSATARREAQRRRLGGGASRPAWQVRASTAHPPVEIKPRSIQTFDTSR